MSSSVGPLAAARHLPLSENPRPHMAKADLRKADQSGEPEGWREAIGRAIERAMFLQGWSLKEFAAAVDRDERQVARWITGSERAQFDTLFAVEALRQPLIQALSELVGVPVHVQITLGKTG